MMTDNYSDDKIVDLHSKKISALMDLMEKTGMYFNQTPLCFEWDDKDINIVSVVDSGGSQIGLITRELFEKLGKI